MKDYTRIKVPYIHDNDEYLGVMGQINRSRHIKFPYIYLANDFSHYLTKNLILHDSRGKMITATIGGSKFRGFETHYIVDKSKIITKLSANKLNRIIIQDYFKDDGRWLYVFNKELRLG